MHGLSRTNSKIVALRAPLEVTCTDKCKIVGRWHNRCNSSYPCSNNVVGNGVAPLLVRRYVVVPPAIILALVSFPLTWITSIKHYPETNSPHQTVSANAKLLRILRSSNSNRRNRNPRSNSNSNSSNSSSSSSSNSNSSRSNSHNHSHHSHSKRHSSNHTNLRWLPLVLFISRVYSLCQEPGMRGACLCLAGRVILVDSVAHRCIQWEWDR